MSWELSAMLCIYNPLVILVWYCTWNAMLPPLCVYGLLERLVFDDTQTT